MYDLNSLKFATLGLLLLLLALVACNGTEPTPEATKEVLEQVFYGNSWTWPHQPKLLAHLSRGKFYISVKSESKIAILDPDAPDYGLKFVETDFVQPHSFWMAPGMRYNWINFQSEGNGDHDAIAIMDTWNDEIIKYIQNGRNDPFHMAFSPTEKLLVSGDLDEDEGWIHLFDSQTQELLESIETTGISTRDILITHDGRLAFIGHQGYDPENGMTGPVDVFDIAERQIVKSLGEGRCRSGKMSPDGTLVLYSCPRADKVIVIDTQSLEIAAEIEVPEGSNPHQINFRSDGKFAYVGLLGADQLGVIEIERRQLVKRLDSGTQTNSTYMHPYAALAVIANDGSDTHVSILDTEANEIIDQIESEGKGTHNGQWSPDGRWFIVSNRLGDTVTLLQYNEQSNTIEWVDDILVGFGPNGVNWAPYFCGVQELTASNVAEVENLPALNKEGECGNF